MSNTLLPQNASLPEKNRLVIFRFIFFLYNFRDPKVTLSFDHCNYNGLVKIRYFLVFPHVVNTLFPPDQVNFSTFFFFSYGLIIGYLKATLQRYSTSNAFSNISFRNSDGNYLSDIFLEQLN